MNSVKTEKITIRVTSEEKAAIEKSASMEDRKTATYVRRTVLADTKAKGFSLTK